MACRFSFAGITAFIFYVAGACLLLRATGLTVALATLESESELDFAFIVARVVDTLELLLFILLVWVLCRFWSRVDIKRCLTAWLVISALIQVVPLVLPADRSLRFLRLLPVLNLGMYAWIMRWSWKTRAHAGEAGFDAGEMYHLIGGERVGVARPRTDDAESKGAP